MADTLSFASSSEGNETKVQEEKSTFQRLCQFNVLICDLRGKLRFVSETHEAVQLLRAGELDDPKVFLGINANLQSLLLHGLHSTVGT